MLSNVICGTVKKIIELVRNSVAQEQPCCIGEALRIWHFACLSSQKTR